MDQLTSPRTRQQRGQPMPTGDAGDPFWDAGIGSGATQALALVARLDLLAHGVGVLPVHAGLTRPVVGQYLCMAKTLASNWSLHHRAALLAALGQLAQFGASVCQPFTVEAMAARCADQGRSAQRVADALERRLAAPLASFDALRAVIGAELAHMAGATRQLDADTRLVTQRLQADQVHAVLLSQQASALQGKAGAAALRTGPSWLDRPQALELGHASTLDAVRRQLAQLRSEQAATGAEADYLQSLLPALAPCLAAAERLAEAIASIATGLHALGARLARLRTDPGIQAGDQDQLLAAIVQWQAIAAALARTGSI
jgi:hypothetical protein